MGFVLVCVVLNSDLFFVYNFLFERERERERKGLKLDVWGYGGDIREEKPWSEFMVTF